MMKLSIQFWKLKYLIKEPDQKNSTNFEMKYKL
jgi:hypothetical protein